MRRARELIYRLLDGPVGDAFLVAIYAWVAIVSIATDQPWPWVVAVVPLCALGLLSVKVHRSLRGLHRQATALLEDAIEARDRAIELRGRAIEVERRARAIREGPRR